MTAQNPLRVYVAQMCSVDHIEACCDQIFLHLELAKSANPDLISFPENCLYLQLNGQLPEAAISLDHPVFKELQAYSDATGAAIHLGGMPLRENDHVYNATVWLQPSVPLEVVYRKIHLFDVEVAGKKLQESLYYRQGHRSSVKSYKGWNIAFSICYDLRFAELYSGYAKRGADLILVPSAFLQTTGEAHWHTLLRARAIESQCFVIAAAQAGQHQSLYASKTRQSYGHSVAYDPWGRLLMDLLGQDFAGGLVELDQGKIGEVRAQIPMAQHRQNRHWTCDS